MIPAQLTTVELTVETVVWAVLAVGLMATGLTITGLALQGYRKYRSRPMLFIALGFGFLMLTQLVVIPLSTLLDVSYFAKRTVIQVTQLAGSVCILYAVYIKRPD